MFVTVSQYMDDDGGTYARRDLENNQRNFDCSVDGTLEVPG